MTRLLQGIPAAPGLAQGAALRWDQQSLQVPRFTPVDPLVEKRRLADARGRAFEQLHNLAAQLTDQIGAADAALFEAQAMFLEDTALTQQAEGTIDTGINAEQAWYDACEYFARQLEALPDETLRARSADVRDVGRRVIEILTGTQSSPLLTGQAIILARDLAPSQTAQLDTANVLAFCTMEGGATSHTAILAKALGIPAVVGLGTQLMDVPDGALLLVDGTTGSVVLEPDASTIASFEQQILLVKQQRALDRERAFAPAVTSDGHRVEVVANVGSVEDARLALEHGAEGIGLLRTEFLFLNRSQAPDEETQFNAYRSILEVMGSRPVVVRTLDVGGDKDVPYFNFGPEANPFLGYRAIRISLDDPETFKLQLRALLRAGAGHDLRIMFPMISSIGEVHQAKSLLREAKMELRALGKEMAETPQIGIMVEIPSVVFLAERFAGEVDFFSIGTNDLTQYTLAAERGNSRVAHLNDPCHPAVLQEIHQTVRAAHQAGIWVGVCGEMAGDPECIPLLLGLGIDELSMAARQSPMVKQLIRKWSMQDAQKLALQALELDAAEDIRRVVREFPHLPNSR